MTTEAPTQPRAQKTDWILVWHKAGHVIGQVLTYAILSVGAIIFALPFLWMLSTSVKDAAFAYAVPMIWIPKEPTFVAYTYGWQTLPFNLFYRNTLTITVANIIGLVLSSSMVAFAFARIRFKGRDPLFLILLSTMMLPAQVTLIPIYVVWSRLQAVNTFWPLIIPEWLANAYNVFLLRQYMMTISPEMDDAARIDGAGWFRIYSQIIMPMSRAALGVVAIQAFAWNWNNFLGPLIYLNETKRFTISIGLRLFQTQQASKMPETMAMSIVAIIPTLIMFFIAQRFFIQGIVISGVKG
jgi:ABC-type glycerol-3-phosphate transport system permease component